MRRAGVPSALALTNSLVARGDRPVLTYCVDDTSERLSLGPLALGSWVARTAAMLRDGYGCGAGDQAAVLLPAHWQTAAVLLGSWSLGMTVSVRPWATAGLPAADAEIGGPHQVVFVSLPRLNSWLEDVPDARHRFVLGLEPDGALLGDTPDGYRDYLAEVRKYPDDVPDQPSRWGAEPATPDGTSFQEWMDLAHDLARTMNLRADDRVLVDADRNEQPVTWLLAPLAVGASIVLCAHLDAEAVEKRAALEGATHVI